MYSTIGSDKLVSYINCSTPTVLFTVNGKKVSLEHRVNKERIFTLTMQ